MELDAAAKAKGVTLGVYQYRRFDADFQTLKRVIDDGRLGRGWRIEIRMDQDSPHTVEQGPAGGLLRDMGSRVVAQMIYLLGPVRTVATLMDHVQMQGRLTDVSYTITLRHESGAHSHLSASKLNHIDARELRSSGDQGCYPSLTTDMQAQDIFAGKRPFDDPSKWGYEPRANWGTLFGANGPQIVPSEQGRYHDYYVAFAKSVREGTPPPVPAETGVKTLAVLDAARHSATEGRSITL